MSTRRNAPYLPLEKGPNGRNKCRECGTEVSGRRIAYCSKKCDEAFSLKANPGVMRSRVFRRDKGICAVCGIRADDVKDAIRTLRHLTCTDWTDRGGREKFVEIVAPLRQIEDILGVKFTNRISFWDADHIKSVVEGGGECGIENMQTLCLWCHKAKTSGLAAKRAAERKAMLERAAGVQQLPGTGS